MAAVLTLAAVFAIWPMEVKAVVVIPMTSFRFVAHDGFINIIGPDPADSSTYVVMVSNTDHGMPPDGTAILESQIGADKDYKLIQGGNKEVAWPNGRMAYVHVYKLADPVSGEYAIEGYQSGSVIYQANISLMTSFSFAAHDGFINIIGPDPADSSTYVVMVSDTDHGMPPDGTAILESQIGADKDYKLIQGGNKEVAWPNGRMAYIHVYKLAAPVSGEYAIEGYQGGSVICQNMLPLVTPFEDPTEGENQQAVPVFHPASSTSGACNHTCEWVTETLATETADGVLAYRCTKCGTVTGYQTGGTAQTSAFAVFNTSVISQLSKAKSGETVSIDTQLWTSFTQEVMEAIAARRDLNIEITYRMAGNNYRILIPAGAFVPVDVEYAGFDGYLVGLYGKMTDLDYTYHAVLSSSIEASIYQ